MCKQSCDCHHEFLAAAEARLRRGKPDSQIEHDSATQNAVAEELITLLPASRGILAHFEVLEKKLHQELLDGGCNIYLRSDLEPALGSRLNKILSFFHVNDTLITHLQAFL